MTFTTKVKEEASKLETNDIENFNELAAIIRYDGVFTKDSITLTLENASIARKIYKSIKSIFNVNPKITIRSQKRFRVKTIYILEILDKVKIIEDSLYIKDDFSKYLVTEEEKNSFFRGTFLACGSISNPSTSGYHFELIFKKAKERDAVFKLIKELNLTPKKIKRGDKYMIYIKLAEEISDILKRFQTINTLFEFEDIRIYRDHKNMVNRLNNCEIANQEKVIKTSIKQTEQINYLKEHDLMDLLDEKTKIIINYREKYPDVSFQELADIISMETDYKIGKSGINHHFIKIKDLIEKDKNRKVD